MTIKQDIRLAEMRLLANVESGVWKNGVSGHPSAKQADALGLPAHMFADMIVTVIEDGYLNTNNKNIRAGLASFGRRMHQNERDYAVSHAASATHTQVELTYRGLRRVDELRTELRRDRILEKFGILLDGRYIVSDLNAALERADGEPTSVVLADVDDFKQFNEAYGYKVGDAVLRAVFSTMKDVVGQRGDVYRSGGEEVVCLLPFTDVSACQEIAERCRAQIESDKVKHQDRELSVTVSIGTATSPPSVPDGPLLEDLAEMALKKAKRSGKNQVLAGS